MKTSRSQIKNRLYVFDFIKNGLATVVSHSLRTSTNYLDSFTPMLITDTERIISIHSCGSNFQTSNFIPTHWILHSETSGANVALRSCCNEYYKVHQPHPQITGKMADVLISETHCLTTQKHKSLQYHHRHVWLWQLLQTADTTITLN